MIKQPTIDMFDSFCTYGTGTGTDTCSGCGIGKEASVEIECLANNAGNKWQTAIISSKNYLTTVIGSTLQEIKDSCTLNTGMNKNN